MRSTGRFCCVSRLWRLFGFLTSVGQASQAPHLKLGSLGEQAAREYLVGREGYSIVASNVELDLARGRDGRKHTGEVDLIAYDHGTLVFVEVKTRTTDRILPPERNVDLRKRRQIARVARRYRQLMKVSDETHRYDVVTVVLGGDNPKIELHRGYFDDQSFRKAR